MDVRDNSGNGESVYNTQTTQAQINQLLTFVHDIDNAVTFMLVLFSSRKGAQGYSSRMAGYGHQP